ncbi:type IV secretion system protein VirB10 [Neisseria zoodegmatis]|uniref:TrbI n=1 Tax=Neisseria zoodegmatis TaxID=326523 RepID=A0AB38DS09_9NEIS|nr:type IV secretion system protein VirB10 [Neisseria zoodegmatis]OSI10953.1 hypothetical protein BWD10_03310 [Neisseria zoodegmatis]SNU80190.1 TrbI [Neisseria zoodegmatis]
MGFFDRFRRRKNQDDGNSVEEQVANSTTMYDKVDNPELEGGVPDVQSSGGVSKSPQQLVLLGVALLGSGLAIAGLMVWLNREPAVEEEPQEKPEISSDSQYDFTADQVRLQQQQEVSAASAPEGITTTQPASAASTVATVEAVSEPVASPPTEPPPKDRKLTGDVLVATDGGATQAAAGAASGSAFTEPVISGLDNSELSGLRSDGDTLQKGSFADKLNPTSTASVQASRSPSGDYLLAKGTNISCTMQTKIVTTQPGFTRCIVDKDVYSANGKVLLLERGTKITGEQTAALLQGQARVFALWNEAETPYGVRVSLASPAAGQLGQAGIGARVNNHFWQRFGGAVMISLIGDLGDYAANRRNSHGEGQTFNFDTTSESAQDMATEALKNSINIPPTGYVNQGSRINIIVARDVDFSRVYERVNPLETSILPTD